MPPAGKGVTPLQPHLGGMICCGAEKVFPFRVAPGAVHGWRAVGLLSFIRSASFAFSNKKWLTRLRYMM